MYSYLDSEVRVLAMTLRDGVLLCNLLLFLDSKSLEMKDFNRKPQMAQVIKMFPHVFEFHCWISLFLQFLCTQNIKLFLDACKNYFGLKESDLFEPGMLYDLTNFHKVLITLSKLSQCRKVQIKHPNIV